MIFMWSLLQAMRCEMREDWDAALEILDSILEEDEANSSARKRKIAIWKAQGETDRAVQELVKAAAANISFPKSF